MNSSQQSVLGFKLPSRCLNTLLASSQGIFLRSVLSPKLEFVLHVKERTSFLWPSWSIYFTHHYCLACLQQCCEPFALCPANNGPVYGVPAFVTLWAQLGACWFATQPNTVFMLKVSRHILNPRSNKYVQQACMKLYMPCNIKKQASQLLSSPASCPCYVASHVICQVTQTCDSWIRAGKAPINCSVRPAASIMTKREFDQLMQASLGLSAEALIIPFTHPTKLSS